MKRWVISMPEYAVTYRKDKRLEWSAETWATWHRLQQRTVPLCKAVAFFSLIFGVPTLLVNQFLFAEDWIKLFRSLISLLVISPPLGALILHTFSCVRAMDRWIYGSKTNRGKR
ncbi:MAG: hypothetical protein DRI77_07620 [Chloroflexi bacterium]|nr:MAG: hypothetical protein DRI77_07620 [Chloroflexota bacterium]